LPGADGGRADEERSALAFHSGFVYVSDADGTIVEVG
jgi:hypothetical protein